MAFKSEYFLISASNLDGKVSAGCVKMDLVEDGWAVVDSSFVAVECCNSRVDSDFGIV